MQDELHNLPSEQDRAISARLAKFRTTPVDTSRLEQMLQGKLPEHASTQDGNLLNFRAGACRPGRAEGMVRTSGATGPARPGSVERSCRRRLRRWRRCTMTSFPGARR
jgi:hypothetical protein